METLEDFFKNGVLFQEDGLYISNTVFKPEDYSLDFFKEKIKPLCYYLFSSLGGNSGNWKYISIFLCETETQRSKEIIKFYNHDVYTPMSAESIEFDYVFLSSEFDRNFNWEKSKFCHLVPTNPFTIDVNIVKQLSDEEEENNIEHWTEEDIEKARRREEEEKRNKQINTGKTFKSDECIICLTNPPNVLFCNCRHIPICVECEEVKSLAVCPVCKTKKKNN